MDSAIKHLGDRAKKTTVIGKLYGSMDLDGDAKGCWPQPIFKQVPVQRNPGMRELRIQTASTLAQSREREARARLGLRKQDHKRESSM